MNSFESVVLWGVVWFLLFQFAPGLAWFLIWTGIFGFVAFWALALWLARREVQGRKRAKARQEPPLGRWTFIP